MGYQKTRKELKKKKDENIIENNNKNLQKLCVSVRRKQQIYTEMN